MMTENTFHDGLVYWSSLKVMGWIEFAFWVQTQGKHSSTGAFQSLLLWLF
jgi:hypothetical protein